MDPNNGANILLIEGGQSYLSAILALREFERQVMRLARDATMRRWKELERISGSNQSKDELIDFKQPESWFDGDSTFVGVKQHLLGINGDFYFSLRWEQQPEGNMWLGATCELEFARRTQLDFVAEKWDASLKASKFPGSRIHCECWTRGIGIYREIDPDEMASVESRLNETLDAWIHGWNLVGSMATCMEQIKKAAEQDNG